MDMYGNPLLPPNRGPMGTFQIKVLIPRMASAAIIGRSGSVIKKMSDISGAKYQLGDDYDPYGTKERTVTINAADSSSVVSGSLALMYQLFEEHKVRNYPILSTNYGILTTSNQYNTPASPIMGMVPANVPIMQGVYHPPLAMNGPGMAYHHIPVDPSYMVSIIISLNSQNKVNYYYFSQGSYIPNPPPPIHIPMMQQPNIVVPSGKISPTMMQGGYSNAMISPQQFSVQNGANPQSIFSPYPIPLQQPQADSFGNMMIPMYPQSPMYAHHNGHMNNN